MMNAFADVFQLLILLYCALPAVIGVGIIQFAKTKQWEWIVVAVFSLVALCLLIIFGRRFVQIIQRWRLSLPRVSN